MNEDTFDTVSAAVDALTREGFTEDFEAGNTSIRANYSKREYQPRQLKITRQYRFEGETNPDDEAVVFAIEATDGTKGTMVISFSADHSENVEMVKKIRYGE